MDESQGPVPMLCENGHPVIAGGQFCSQCGAPAVLPVVSEVRCPAGHVIPDGNEFCGTCGQKAAIPPAPIPELACPNGHAVVAGTAFCEECGSPLVAVSASDGDSRELSVTPSSTEQAPERNGRLSAPVLLAAIGGVLLLVVVVVVLATTSHKQPVATDQPSPSATALSASDVCYNQLFQVVYNMSNHIGNEQTINGVSDPFYMEGLQLDAQFLADSTLYGKKTAQSNFERGVRTWCSQHNNPRRAGVDDYGNAS